MSDRAGRKTTEVAVGVLIRADGAVLLADRPAGKAYAGYWEFPGGKVEPGETVAVALARELREELGIVTGPSAPWVTFEFDYPHAYVRLHFERIYTWDGTPAAHEGQRLAFCRLEEPVPSPLLPAAIPALRWLRLPELLDLDDPARAGARIVSAVELRSARERPECDWAGAFAETRADIEIAARLRFDFAVVAVDPHGRASDVPRWEAFAALARDTPVPIYARGNLARDDLADARRSGAHGIAFSVAAARR